MSLNINDLQLADKNIIIVEDDLPSVRYYETLLASTRANIKVLQNGKEFVDYINDPGIKVDLIIMDFLVPLINGIECLRIFRKGRKNVPVLMITAYSSEQSKTEAYLAGANEYILKPVYPEKIFTLLEKYLKQEIAAPLL